MSAIKVARCIASLCTTAFGSASLLAENIGFGTLAQSGSCANVLVSGINCFLEHAFITMGSGSHSGSSAAGEIPCGMLVFNCNC